MWIYVKDMMGRQERMAFVTFISLLLASLDVTRAACNFKIGKF